MPRPHAVLLLLACAALQGCGDLTGVRQRPGSEPPVTESGNIQLLWYEIEPRVLVPNGTGQVRITAKFTNDGYARVVLRDTWYAFTQVGATWQAIVPEAELMEQYRAGDLHHIAARIDVGTTPTEYTVNVNVAATGLVVPVAITSLGAGVKATPHVLNIRTDSIYGGRTVPAALLKEAYKYLGDDYDFLMVIEAVRSPNNRFYTAMRNQVTGIGLASYDQGKVYGSDARLQGVVHFPNDDFFDLAETSTLHEIAHRWVNYTHVSALQTGTPHWPMSDLAYGVMGRSDPSNARQAIAFPYQLEPQSNGDYIARRTTAPTDFNDLELYLMGLLPADSVRPHFVFRNQSQTARPDGTLQGPVDTVRISDVIAQEGARAPAYPFAPRVFTVGTIVLSRGRLLTNTELWFFDHMVTRGEASAALPYQIGLNRGDTRPFSLATGNRGRLQATLKY